METASVNKMRKSRAAEICRRQILSPPGDSKLCFVLHEINFAAQNNLPLPPKSAGGLFSRNSKIIGHRRSDTQKWQVVNKQSLMCK
jgi:hypothetical protein